MRYLAAALLALAWPAQAQAEWYESSSAHFVVYADDSERNIRQFTEQLERFHRAMALTTGLQSDPPSPSNRVTVFVVRSAQQVRRILGDGSQYAAGFYIPRAGGSIAVVPRVQVNSRETDTSMLILLHEYAHHFMYRASSFPLPLWLVEGGAEFFASTKFEADGSVNIGMPLIQRAPELFHAPDVDAAELLDPDLYEFDRRSGRYDSFYGKSWLLYHYLSFDAARAGQLRRYLAGLLSGLPSRQAAEAAFGDLRKLEADLGAYMRRRTMLSVVLSPDQLGQPAVSVRRLTAGEEAIMPVRLRSRRGVTRDQAIDLVADARRIAASHPGDAAVLSALAEAEFDAGNDAEAIAAADAALAIDPRQVNAYVQKGYALFRRATQAPEAEKDAAFERAVEPFLALNRLENDHPLPLIYYFRSYADRRLPPPEIAVQGLERAAELAPFDLIVRLKLSRQQAIEGRMADARYNLMPVAYNPHGGAYAQRARAMLERLESGPLTREEIEALFAPPADAASELAGAR